MNDNQEKIWGASEDETKNNRKERKIIFIYDNLINYMQIKSIEDLTEKNLEEDFDLEHYDYLEIKKMIIYLTAFQVGEIVLIPKKLKVLSFIIKYFRIEGWIIDEETQKNILLTLLKNIYNVSCISYVTYNKMDIVLYYLIDFAIKNGISLGYRDIEGYSCFHYLAMYVKDSETFFNSIKHAKKNGKEKEIFCYYNANTKQGITVFEILKMRLAENFGVTYEKIPKYFEVDDKLILKTQNSDYNYISKKASIINEYNSIREKKSSSVIELHNKEIKQIDEEIAEHEKRKKAIYEKIKSVEEEYLEMYEFQKSDVYDDLKI